MRAASRQPDLTFTFSSRLVSIAAPAPSWTLLTSLATTLIRSNDRRRSLRSIRNPPRSRAQLIAVAQKPSPAEWLEVAADKLRGAVVSEFEIPVRKRELPGLLSELSAHETGQRTIPVSFGRGVSVLLPVSRLAQRKQAEWVIHDSLLRSSGAEHRKPRDKVVLFMHGGAHIIMSPKTHRKMVAEISRQFRCSVICACLALSSAKNLQHDFGKSLAAVDYRLSPGVVFPASTLDSVSAYLYLTEGASLCAVIMAATGQLTLFFARADLGIPASDIIVAGDSAGGNLALTLMQYLRDAGLPQVGAGFLACPWVDLSCSFSSWDYNKVSSRARRRVFTC